MAFVPLLAIPVQLQDPITSVNMSGGTLEFFLAGSSTATNLFSDNSGTSIGTSITLNSGGFPASGNNVITLFRDSSIAIKIVGKNAAGTVIFTSDQLEDALVLLASVASGKGAALVGIADAGAHFAATTVEVALQDIGLNYLKRTEAIQIEAVYTFASPGSIQMGDQDIVRAVLKDYALTNTTPSSSSGTLTIDLTNGNSFETTLTENITTVSIINPPDTGAYGQFVIKITQDASGGAFTVTWPSSVKWPAGTAPVITVTNGAIDEITLRTRNAGTEWLGSFSQAFA